MAIVRDVTEQAAGHHSEVGGRFNADVGSLTRSGKVRIKLATWKMDERNNVAVKTVEQLIEMGTRRTKEGREKRRENTGSTY